MSGISPGRACFALGISGLGVLSLISGDFAYTWQPVPEGLPWREALARISGLFLVTGGAGLLLEKRTVAFSRGVALYLLSWVVVLHGPPVVRAPLDVGAWLGVAENLILMTGAWILCLGEGGAPRSLRVARFLVGASCLILGLSHFVYASVTAGMIPSWIPAHLGFAYFTGSAHAAAGAAILLGIVPRLAATLEAVMVSLFVILLHAPGVAGAWGNRLQWTMFFVATALAGALWLLAGTYRTTPQPSA